MLENKSSPDARASPNLKIKHRKHNNLLAVILIYNDMLQP